jgi:lipopolysaccharide export LptBFGC system permease protein LptF
VSVVQKFADGHLTRLQAPEVVWTNGHWLFLTAEQFLYRSDTDDDPRRVRMENYSAAELSETPDQLRAEWRIGQLSLGRVIRRPQIPLRDILDFRRLHPVLQPRERTFIDTQLHARLAAPWTCLVVVFIAVPFGAPSGRRNIFFGVAGSIAIGFCYFVVQRVGFALGQNGTLPPWLSAWLPNLGFATAGLLLIRRVR